MKQKTPASVRDHAGVKISKLLLRGKFSDVNRILSQMRWQRYYLFRYQTNVLEDFLYIKKDFKAINVANSEVLNFVLGQTEGRVRADLLTLQGDNTQ